MEVWTGVLSKEADALNRPFFKFMRTGLPWVTLKAAVTLDGKLATATGDSRWVTGEAARAEVHRAAQPRGRHAGGGEHGAGGRPPLTTRLPEGGGKDPLRAVLDSALQLSPGGNCSISRRRRERCSSMSRSGWGAGGRACGGGAELLAVPGRPGEVDLEAMLRALLQRDVLHVLVEGGPRVFLCVPPRGAGGFARPAPGTQAGGR